MKINAGRQIKIKRLETDGLHAFSEFEDQKQVVPFLVAVQLAVDCCDVMQSDYSLKMRNKLFVKSLCSDFQDQIIIFRIKPLGNLNPIFDNYLQTIVVPTVLTIHVCIQIDPLFHKQTSSCPLKLNGLGLLAGLDLVKIGSVVVFKNCSSEFV
jgi:hypothetical protein